jgi:ribosomal protein S27E
MKQDLTCPGCAQTVTTGAAPGKTIACKKCGTELRVPLREVTVAARTPLSEVSVARTLTCPACEQTFETTTPPGKRTTCKQCGVEVRVPLREASLTRPAGRAAERLPEDPTQRVELLPLHRSVDEMQLEALVRLPEVPERAWGLAALAMGPLMIAALYAGGVGSVRAYGFAVGVTLVGALLTMFGDRVRRLRRRPPR